MATRQPVNQQPQSLTTALCAFQDFNFYIEILKSMATCRRFLNLAKGKSFRNISPKCYSTSVEVKPESSKDDEIVIPYRIHRGPTDILKALASTISKDYTAAQYKYEDDPYLIPASNITKRSFALSKESGRKAARYFLEKYPELFLCNKSVPHIKAFDPPIVYTEENIKSPDVLVECIKNADVNNSIKVYKILKEKGLTVSQEIKQDLLELLCFSNGIQPPDEDYYEERYFRRPERFGERWNQRGEAERLFDEMEKDSKAYSALIAGAAKFQDAGRALMLLDEMKSKGLIPTVEAYNGAISIVPYMNEKRESGCEYALFLLGNMQKEGVRPNLYTMNAILEVFCKKRFRKTAELTKNLLAEMNNLNIEPSLGSYSFILNIFLEDVNVRVGALYEIISKIENKEWTIRHPEDVMFFTNAMDKCYKYAQDKSLAYRINKVVEYRNNCKLLGNALSESVYFKNFLRILSEHEDFEKFMEIYEQYVPNTYTPEPALMVDILQKLQFTGHFKYLPKLCNHVYVFEQTERENVLSVILEIAGSMTYEKEIQEELVDIIWKIVEKLNIRLESGRFNFSWTGADLGNALITFLNGKDKDKAWSIMEQLNKNEMRIIGPPSKDSLLKFCELFLENKEYEKVKFCLKYAIKEAYPEFCGDFKKLTDVMFEKAVLEEQQRVHVNDILQRFSVQTAAKKSASDSSNDLSSNSSSDSSDDSSSDSSSSDEEDNK